MINFWSVFSTIAFNELEKKYDIHIDKEINRSK